MLYEVLIQVRRDIPFYLAVVTLTVALNVWRAADSSSAAAVAAQLFGGLVLWLLMLVVGSVDLFGFYWASRDQFLLISPWSRGGLLAAKAAVHGIWWLFIFTISWIITSSEPHSGPALSIGAVAGVIGARASSILTFLSLITMLIRLAKLVRNQIAAIAVVVVGWLLVTVAGVWWLVCATDAQSAGREWVIGVNSAVTAPAQYANVLPIVIESHVSGAPVAAVEPAALAGNAVVVAATLATWWAVCRTRVDFVKAA